MGAWVLRIMAAVGVVTVVIILSASTMVLISLMIDKRNRHDDGLELDAKHGYAIIQGGKHYIADAPDLEKAREIIKVDEYGMWKTERGISGPWKLMEERHD